MIYFTLFFALAFAQDSQTIESNPDCNSAYCSACDNNLKCTECIDNYHLVNGECVYDYLCNKFDSDSFGNEICIRCEKGYKFDIDKRECVKDKFEPCLYYGYDSERDYHQCLMCELGYALYKGECVDCTEEQPHCRDFDTNLDDVCGHCISCEDGYKLEDCKCVLDIDDICLGYGTYPNDYCYEGCRPGYYRNNEDKCVKGTIDGCAVYKEYFDEGECHEECEICIYSYELHDGRCYKGETKHCIFYEYINGNYVCQQCEEGYSVDKDYECFQCKVENCGICSAFDHSKCIACKEGYGLNSKTGKCQKCSNGCLECQIDFDGKETCSYCSDGYRDKNGVCEKCKKSNCNSCIDSADTCDECEDGYYLSDNDECVQCSENNCERCPGDLCFNCKEGYHWSYNKCFKEIENCIIYDEEGKCTVCEEGYEINKEKCVIKEITDGCYQYNDNENSNSGLCLICRDGWYMKEDYTCAKCTSPCKTCVYESNECIEYNEIEGCNLYEKDGKCKECYEMYNLKKGKCELKKEYHSCYVAESYEIYDDERYNGELGEEKCSLCVVVEYDEEIGYYTYSRVYHPENGKCGVKSIAILLLVALLTFLF